MYFTDAKKAHYKAGVPRDTKTFYENMKGITCPKCNINAGFSILNESLDWEKTSPENPFRCAACLHEWNES